MPIALDIDGVLIEEPWQAFAEFLRSQGYSFDESAYLATHSLKAATGLDKAALAVPFRKFRFSATYPAGQPIPGAKEALGQLQQRFSLFTITSRDVETCPQTIEELQRHFGPVSFRGYLFDTDAPKYQLAIQSGCHVLVDDKYQYALPAHQHGLRAILFLRECP